MARIIKKGAGLEKQLANCRRRSKNGFAYALIFFVIGILGVFPRVFSDWKIINILSSVWAIAFMIVAVVFIIRAMNANRQINILSAGIEGERDAESAVRSLPDSYTVFRNLTIHYNGKSSEIDVIIVGPSGVFVVETKNLNGSIRGNATDRDWIQHKVGRGGTPYSRRFYSPLRQVNTHVYKVANFLRDNGVNVYVNAAVYFSNFETDVRISGTDGETEIFSAGNNGANDLLSYVMNNNRHISRAECEKIVNLLKRM